MLCAASGNKGSQQSFTEHSLNVGNRLEANPHPKLRNNPTDGSPVASTPILR